MKKNRNVAFSILYKRREMIKHQKIMEALSRRERLIRSYAKMLKKKLAGNKKFSE